MNGWFNVKDGLPGPNTKVEVMFSFVASGEPVRQAWPCTFHPKGSSPPMFIFQSWLGDPTPPSLHGEVVAWRYR